MSKNFVTTTLLLLFILLISLFSYSEQQHNAQPLPLPEFSLPDLQEKTHSISEWQGKIRIINFWATWCPPCLKEIPIFMQLQQEYADKNVQFIGIAIDDPASVEDYLSFMAINYPILMAPAEGGLLAKQLGNVVNAIPYTVIVNQNNEITFRHPGELSKELIENQLNTLLVNYKSKLIVTK